MRNEPFTIDLADPTSIQQRLAEVEGEVISRREQLKHIREELTYWEVLYQRLSALSGNLASQPKAVTKTVRQRIIDIVNEAENVPVDVDYVMQLLPAGTKRKTVSWNLWDLERKGEIQRVTDGMYARLDYEPDTLLHESSAA